eukprot:2951931-Amphidinium_carterae.1
MTGVEVVSPRPREEFFSLYRCHGNRAPCGSTPQWMWMTSGGLGNRQRGDPNMGGSQEIGDQALHRISRLQAISERRRGSTKMARWQPSVSWQSTV